MKRYFLLTLIVITSYAFCQKSDYNFHLDNYTVLNIKNYETKEDCIVYNFYSTKDSLIMLELDKHKYFQQACLINEKEKSLIRFEVDFNYLELSDLNKLKNGTITDKNYSRRPSKIRSEFGVLEVENDTINKKVLLHLTNYNNEKHHKIVSELYFYVETFANPHNYLNSLNNYLTRKYKFDFGENQKIVKILELKKGKILEEWKVLEHKTIDFDFKFSAINQY